MFILNFSFILYSLLFYVLFLFIGLGLTILFSPKEWLKYTVFLSPLIGYCLITLTGWFFYSLNFKGTDDYYYWILLIALLLLIGAIIKIWKQKILKKLFSRELIITVMIAIIIFLAIAFPSLRQEELTSMSLGNNDVDYYSLTSKILKEFPKNDSQQIIDYVSVSEPIIGASLYTAFFCSVMKLDPYQVQMISIYIFFIILLLLTFILAREVFAYTRFAANVIILLCGLNSLAYFVIYQVFECQIIAMSLMLLIILCNTAIVRANKFSDAVRYAPFLFLSLWGISLTYNHMIVVIYGLIIPYVLLFWWTNRKVTKLLNWAAINCIAVLVIVCLSPQSLSLITSNTSILLGNPFGWFMAWITPQKLYGITPLFSPDTLVITIPVTIFLVAVIIPGFVKLYKNDRENFLFSSTMFLLIFIGALILSIQNIDKAISGGFGGYNQFKLISFFLPVLLLSSFALFRDMTCNMRGILQSPVKSSPEYVSIRTNTLYLLIISALVISNCMSAGIMIYRATKTAFVISPDIINLQVIKNNKEIESINIPFCDPTNAARSIWITMWEAYFLFPHKLFIEQPIFSPAKPLNGQWTLIRKATGSPGNYLSIIRKNDQNIMPINSSYSLRKGPPAFSVKFGEGWSDNQGVSSWTTSDVASIIIDSTTEKMRTNLMLKYWPLIPQNNLSIYLNGVKIMDCDNNNLCVIKELLFKKGENIIEFRAKLPAELPGNGDPRKLCYCFELIQFEEIE